ncbi:MAG TPA: hypothetical protein VKR99_05445, partial [Candidatus Eremiobacteraceae bacterium]|nr:hypothetical protein [Candidatus Eremiobacteraceae bacterium]
MDQDTHLAPALERVTASVAETQRRRLDLERELGEAQHVIASLKNQSSALEMSLLDLQTQLDATLQAKAQEDAALADIARQKEAALQDLTALRSSIDALLTEKDRTAGTVTAAFDDLASALDHIQSDIESTSRAAAAMAGEVNQLRERVATVRDATETADRQLADVHNKSAAVNDAIALLRSDADQIASALSAMRQRKEQAEAAGVQLEALMRSLEQQRGEAELAADSMRSVIASRRQQADAITAQMRAMSQLISNSSSSAGGGANGAPAAVEPSAVETNGATEPRRAASAGPNAFPRTTATVKLLGAEQFLTPDEAARIVALLDEGEVNKVVRSLWSRAVGGTTPGVYRLVIADALNESGDFKAAMTFYNQALATRHLDVFLTYLVAVSLFTAAKSDDALKLAKVLAREKNGKVLSRNIEAIYYMRSNKLDEAE